MAAFNRRCCSGISEEDADLDDLFACRIIFYHICITALDFGIKDDERSIRSCVGFCYRCLIPDIICIFCSVVDLTTVAVPIYIRSERLFVVDIRRRRNYLFIVAVACSLRTASHRSHDTESFARVGISCNCACDILCEDRARRELFILGKKPFKELKARSCRVFRKLNVSVLICL